MSAKRGGKRHFLFLPPPKPPEGMVFDESGVAAVGVDFDQAPWPTEPTYWNIVCDYIREHAIPSRCKWRSSFTILLRGVFIFEEGLTRSASSFKRADGLHYITARRADEVKDGSIRRELAIIYAAFRHALQWERIQKAPIFPKPPTSPARLRWFTHEEVQRLMLVPKPWRRQMYWILAFETGCRPAAIEDLTWDRVDLVNRVIDFRIPKRVHKNKRRPIAPISDRLYPRLVAAKARWERRQFEDPFVIGRGGSTYNGCKADCAAIGIVEYGVARHVARHTFCSWRMQLGFSRGTHRRADCRRSRHDPRDVWTPGAGSPARRSEHGREHAAARGVAANTNKTSVSERSYSLGIHMDELMKQVYKALGIDPTKLGPLRTCMHGKEYGEFCLSCDQQEERRDDARRVMEEYRKAKDGE